MGEKHSSLVVVSLGFLSFEGLVAVNNFPVSIMVPSVPRGTVPWPSLVNEIVVATLGTKSELRAGVEGIYMFGGIVSEAVDVFVGGAGTSGGMCRGMAGVFCAASGNKLPPKIGIDFPEAIAPRVLGILRGRSSFAEEDLKGGRILEIFPCQIFERKVEL